MEDIKSYAPRAATIDHGHGNRLCERRPFFILMAIVLVFSIQYFLPYKVFSTSNSLYLGPKPFEWSSITPSPQLEYHPCFDIFQCARLEVPLDWNSTAEDGGTKAAIAIMKKPAKVAVTDSRYGGPILINPGGPGGAGTFFMPIYGAALQEIVDTPNEKYFDILSWDPRGIGFTTPSHPGISDPGTLREFTQQLSSIGLSLEENEVFNKVWSLEGIYGVTISSYTAEQMESGELVGQFVSTANVVRDMVEIIERHGEWREKTARTAGSLDEDVQRIAWRQGKEPLQYWGFSYGTILGQAFASMQPSRVYRVVLDGVADAEDYMATGWTSNLWDIEKINEKFAAACVDAGEDLCPIAAWSPGDAAGLLSKFLAALEDLKSNPVATMIGDTPVFVSHSDVLQTIFALWYNGYVGFGATAQLMAELSSNNVSTIFSRRPPFSCQHPNVMIRDTNAASAGVLCTDGQSVVNETKADYREYMSLLRHQSPTFADIWATIRMPCHGYGVRAKWRFSGPFGAKTPVGILFASQDLDPVTPLRNAISASNLFPGSQVLEVQGGAGHCTLGFPSICAAKKIREYFRTGSLSTDRTVCPVSADPFWTQEMQEAGLEKLSAQDQKVAKLVMEVATAWPPREQQLFERSSVFSM